MRVTTRIIQRISVLIVGTVLLFPKYFYACPYCFGATGDNPTSQGISYAMLALLVLTGTVLTGIVLFFKNMQKRARKIASGEMLLTEQGNTLTHPGLVKKLHYK
ncbi:MAG: hypothetical protein GWN00_10460, partial [Aliifodinibius sp.]|nr:hypothetical protein [Fodinibius sp.]NIV12440.1 hypothetical protein [Fodinibius sp.]NIY25210.1 hypothetical protein [Fodinibius sp.]